MPSARVFARLLLIGLVVAARGQPVPEQPPVVREFLQIRNHAVKLTSERLVSSLSHLLYHFIVIASVTGPAFL